MDQTPLLARIQEAKPTPGLKKPPRVEDRREAMEQGGGESGDPKQLIPCWYNGRPGPVLLKVPNPKAADKSKTASTTKVATTQASDK
jgi:hypothetical protein